MADTIEIVQGTATVVEVAGPTGPQGPSGSVGATGATGPAGPAGTGIETLTTKGDLLSRDDSAAIRVGIGSVGQILKVSAQGLPTWANESGAVTSVNGATGAVVVAAEQHAAEHEAGEADEIQATAALVDTDYLPLNGVYFHDGTFTNGRPNFFKTGTRKNTKLEYNTQWKLIRNNVVEAVGVDGPNTVPWGQTWEEFVTPTSVTVTQLPLETMVQKLAETGAPGTATTSEDGLMSSADKTKLNGIASGATANTASSATPSALGTAAAGSATDYARADHIHSAEVSDSAFRVTGSTDATKKVAIEVDTNVPSGQTVTLTAPSASGTLALAGAAPAAHAASHATGGTDALAPSDIGAQSIFVQLALTTGIDSTPYQLSTSRAIFVRVFATENFTIRVPASGHQIGDIVEVRAETLAATKTITVQRDISDSGVWVTLGTLDIQGQKRRFRATSTASNGWQEDSYFTTDGTIGAPSSHTHELTALAATGATNGHVLTANGSNGATFAALPSSGVTGAASSASDVLGVSGANITGVDAGSADRLVFWDDSASKPTYLEAGSGLSISGTTLTATGGSGGATNLWIPASAWIPRTTGGCGVDSREIGATNRANVDELLFDTGTEEFAQALVVMPSNYNNSTITARFYWTAASGSGGVAWGISGRAYGDDDALDQATGTRIVVTDTFITANDVHVTSATSAVTIAGTPAANKAVNFQIVREVGNGSDTLGVDARLLGVEIIFN